MQTQNFSWKDSNHLDVPSSFVYCSCLYILCKLNYGYHNQARFPMEHFSAVKFDVGYEEKYELPCDTKI